MKVDYFSTTAPRGASGSIQLTSKTRRSSGFCEADDRARTDDLLHGKQTLYQLSYIRENGRL